jgi:hypothetical protein
LKEMGLSGLCGPYAIVNALTSILQLSAPATVRRALAHKIASVLPVSLASLKRDGTDRGQLLAMLAAAQSITALEAFGAWNWTESHPRHGQSGAGFWAWLKGNLEGETVAIVGFGDYHARSAYYEPHWTCVEAVKGGWAHCLDSDVYDRVRTSETGIRPERGWEIEDCFILRSASAGITP